MTEFFHNDPEAHKPVFVEKTVLHNGFSFHPKLETWLTSLLALTGNETITVYEAGCTEESCPIEETILDILDVSGKSIHLKIGRSKNQISKNDLYFAIKKQL